MKMEEYTNIRPELSNFANEYYSLYGLLIDASNCYTNKAKWEVSLNHDKVGDYDLYRYIETFLPNKKDKIYNLIDKFCGMGVCFSKFININNPKDYVDETDIKNVIISAYEEFLNFLNLENDVFEIGKIIASSPDEKIFESFLFKIQNTYFSLRGIIAGCFVNINIIIDGFGFKDKGLSELITKISQKLHEKSSQRLVEDDNISTNQEETISSTSKTESSKKIFIIHGHDNHEKDILQNYLWQKYKVDSTVLASEIDKGSETVIEKFESSAQECDLAIAILTPDDNVFEDLSGETGSYSQPRPNVFFEIGWFCGKHGRKKIKVLVKEGTKFDELSDLKNIIRVPYKKAISECYAEIIEFLKENGKI